MQKKHTQKKNEREPPVQKHEPTTYPQLARDPVQQHTRKHGYPQLRQHRFLARTLPRPFATLGRPVCRRVVFRNTENPRFCVFSDNFGTASSQLSARRFVPLSSTSATALLRPSRALSIAFVHLNVFFLEGTAWARGDLNLAGHTIFFGIFVKSPNERFGAKKKALELFYNHFTTFLQLPYRLRTAFLKVSFSLLTI